jgi:hypothetical protein
LNIIRDLIFVVKYQSWPNALSTTSYYRNGACLEGPVKERKKKKKRFPCFCSDSLGNIYFFQKNIYLIAWDLLSTWESIFTAGVPIGANG